MDTKNLNFISNSNGNNLNNPSQDDLEKVRSLFLNMENKVAYYQEDIIIRELIFLVLRNQNGETNNNTLLLLVGLKKISKKHLYMEKNTIIHSLLKQTEEPNNINKCNIVLSDINNKLPKDVSEQIKPETKSNILNQLLANTNKSNFYNTHPENNNLGNNHLENNSSNNIYTLELDNTYQSISENKENEEKEKEENNKFKLDPGFIDGSQYKSSLKAQYIDNDIQFKNNVKGVTEPTLTQDVDGKKYYFDPLSHTFTPLPKDKKLKGVSLEKVENLLLKQNVSPDDINQLKYPGVDMVNSKNNKNDNKNDNKNLKIEITKTTTTTTTTDSNVNFYHVAQYILMILIIIVLLYSLGSFFFQKKSNKATSPPSNSRTSRPSPSPSSNNNLPFDL